MDAILKREIMDELERRGDRFEKKSDIQYRMRCPFCGDSQKSFTSAHCYIKCNYNDPTEPIKYNCFLCNRGGYVGPIFLEKLGADKNLINSLQHYRHNTIGYMKEATFDILVQEPIMNSPQTRFIEGRLGPGFTYEDYSRFKIIWDMDAIRSVVTDQRILNTLPNNSNRIQFLSDNKSMLLSRSFIEDSSTSQWRKIKLFNTQSRSFYTIRSTLDLFTSDTITVNVAEGIMDILSVYKNFNDGENSIYIATLGSDYLSAVDYAVGRKGFIGKNINLKIYIDQGIDERSLMRELKKYKWLFSSIKVYKNIKYKDVGVRIENIKLMEVL